MKKITFDKDKIINYVDEGMESTVYKYDNGSGTPVALKLLKDEYNDNGTIEIIPYSTFENKEKKLQILSRQKCLRDDVKLYDLVYDNDGKFIGYTEEYEKYKSMTTIFTSVFKRKLKLKLLKDLRRKLDELNRNGIFIGDFNSDNFGINEDDTVKLFDMDNYYVQGLDFDRDTNLIREYRRKSPNIIDNIDRYCFNYYTLGFYMSVTPTFVSFYLRDKELPRKFNTPENRQLRLDLKNVGNGNRLGYFIDSTK